MATLRHRLARVERRRETLRRGRVGRPTAALIGYTNAGKSTLMHRLTGADVLVRDQLFATLDTTTRAMTTAGNEGAPNGSAPDGTDILLIDTVGFIRKLPDHLVTSFRATLADTAQAQLYLHVVDVSHPAFEEQMRIADETVSTIDNPGVETLYVFNKVDLAGEDAVRGLRERYPEGSFISAQTGDGVDKLAERIRSFFARRNVRVEIRVDAGDGRTIATVRGLIHAAAGDYEEDVCVLTGHVDPSNMQRLESLEGASVRFLF